MDTSIKSRAKLIYSQFSNAPVLEMVQYMVDQHIDAQLLHQLKLLDMKAHKNPHVKSYADRVYNMYERVCKVLVTYPSLEFKHNHFGIIKDKDAQFAKEYFGANTKRHMARIEWLIKLANLGLSQSLESNDTAFEWIQNIVQDEEDVDMLSMFLVEVTGENYRDTVQLGLFSDLNEVLPMT
jgi:hypothetical protein